MFSRAIVIPHAGEHYAGKAREAAFEAMNGLDVTKIVYLGNVHGAGQVSEVWAADELPMEYKGEHSYMWVAGELAQKYPSATVDVFYASQGLRDAERFAPRILSLLSGDAASHLLVAAVDFIHYGSEQDYGTPNDTLVWPWRASKMAYEAPLITALLALDSEQVNKQLDELRYASCSPGVLRLLPHLLSASDSRGRVVEYYDSDACFLSSHCRTSAAFEWYAVDPAVTERPRFVSYCSIAYAARTDDAELSEFDVRFAFGLLFSVLLRTLTRNDYRIDMPEWSPWSRMTNGIFVGTQNGPSAGTNCSYGRYEDGTATGRLMLEAMSDCARDSVDRWRDPITRKTLPQVVMKIEVLQARDGWARWPSIEDFMDAFQLDGQHGVYLRLADGRAATYLPVVSAEQASKWTVRDYLTNLAQKAGGTAGDLRRAEVHTYSTDRLFWSSPRHSVQL